MTLKTTLLGAAALVALAPAAFAERGADGHVNIIYWQAPSILNPYLSGGTKDLESASIIIEPLGRYDQTGAMVPYLAAEIPTLENGQRRPDPNHMEAEAGPAVVRWHPRHRE